MCLLYFALLCLLLCLCVFFRAERDGLTALDGAHALGQVSQTRFQ